MKIALTILACSLLNTAFASDCRDYASAMKQIEDQARFQFAGGIGKFEHTIYVSAARGSNYHGAYPESYTALVTAVNKDIRYAEIPMMGSITVMTSNCAVRPEFSTASVLE